MKMSTLLGMGVIVAGLSASNASAQQAPAPALLIDPAALQVPTRVDQTYREPLDGRAERSAVLLPGDDGKSQLPVFPTGPTSLQRVSSQALGFVGKVAFAMAAARTGTITSVPLSSYQPYQAYAPGLPLPEPAVAAIGCQPNGAIVTPTICVGH